MIKKILSAVLCLCLIFGINAVAENSDGGTNAPAVSEEMPMQGGRGPGGMGGGRGGMGGNMPENMPSGESPVMPEEKMPPANDMEIPALPGEETTETTDEQVPDFTLLQEPEQSATSSGIADFLNTYATHICTGVALVGGFLFVIFYKRKNY